MTAGRALATYMIFWVIVAFAVLPWRVRTAEEEGRAGVPGEMPGAPADPRLLWKAKWTTIVATALFAAYWLNDRQGWVTMADFPQFTPPR